MSQGIYPSPAVMNTTVYNPSKHLAPIDLKLDANEGSIAQISIPTVFSHISTETLRRYPNTDVLTERLAQRNGIAVDRILVTAGADDALDRVCRALLGPHSELVFPAPSFEMIPRFVQWAYGSVIRVEWSYSEFPLADVINSISEKTKVVSLVSPNNPTGAVVTADDLITLSQVAPQALIMLDHAYVEFVDQSDLDLTALALTLDNVCVFRTFSKAWGLAGCRVGYVMGPQKVIHWLKQIGHPYSVSSLSIVLVNQALDVDQYLEQSVLEVQKERIELTKLLQGIEGEVIESQGNFVFYRGPKAKWLYDALAGLGIAIRNWPTDQALCDAVRITCPGHTVEFERLIKAIKTALEPQGILFDLDGVIAEVSRSYRATIIATAASYHVEVTAEDIAEAKAIGHANNDWRLTHDLLKQRGLNIDLSEVIERFETIYQGKVSKLSPHSHQGLYLKETMIPARETLLQLCQGRQTAIVTGRPLKDALMFLNRFELTDLFQEIITMEDAPAKPNPAPVQLALSRLGIEHAWMLGDTVDDIRAARDAQVIPIAVLLPNESDPSKMRRYLESAGASRVIDDISELLGWLP